MSDSARDAATVVLLRDGDAGIETYLMRRASTMAFAPRMHVYPGGRVEDEDYGVRVELTVDPDEQEALALRASTDVAGLLALYQCALREVQEEVGLELVHEGERGFRQVDPAALPIMDHWVTPEVESKRYDVRFFVTVVPEGELVELTTTEADGAFWISPAEALERGAAGELAMLPPTQATLRYLTFFLRARDVVEAAARRAIVPLLPRRLTDESGATRWVLVNDRTGEIVADPVDAPHTKETDGLSFPEHLR